MHFPLSYRLAAATVGAAAITLTASGVAQASTAKPVEVAKPAAVASIIGDAPSSDIAGYTTTGRWVRYISVNVKLPSGNQCAQQFYPRSPDGDGFAITLGPAEESNAGVPLSSGAASTLGVSFVPSLAGCGLISPSFASNLPGAPQFPAGAVTLTPGDTVNLSLYYSQGAKFTQAVVVDKTNGTSAHLNFDGAATYVNASATAGFGPFHPQNVKAKLWAPKPVAVTTYTGKHGNLATFRPAPIVLTSDGTTAGATYAWPGALWPAGGSNFSVFGR